MLGNALAYVSQGWPCFPCKPLGKAPLTGRGFLDASRDADQIGAWWRRWPDANVAIPTGPGTFDALDVDVRATGNGWAALDRLRRTGLLAGALRIVRTPSGGLHVHYPASGCASGSVSGQYLDFKGNGGYVLMPPSLVATDDYEGMYELLDERPEEFGHPLDWQACVRLLAPPRPAHRVNHRGDHGGDIAPLARWLRRQPEGNRNRALFWASMRAIEDGVDDLAELAAAAVDAGLHSREVERTVASALRGAR